jgi:hypothetical protein
VPISAAKMYLPNIEKDKIGDQYKGEISEPNNKTLTN